MLRNGLVFWVILTCSLLVTAQPVSSGLKVSENQRFLSTQAGKPFFYLADTGWELFHKLTREEATFYLRNRAAKGFNVIQCVLLSEINGLTVPNREGQLPFHDLDPARPNEAYFNFVDEMVIKARDFGLFLAILPTWGAHVEDKAHPLFDNVHPFNPENAELYGNFLGQRYKDFPNIIWVMGGDREPYGNEAIWDALVKGLKTKAGNRHLFTYHTWGGKSSSEYYHSATWLDFNMIQSGHVRQFANNYDLVAKDYQRAPVKPVVDGETTYEGLPIAFSEGNPRFSDADVRFAAYQAVFSGAFGFAYGHNSVWQMYRPELNDQPILDPSLSWRDALEAPGGSQMQYLRNLIESRPFFERKPMQDAISTSPSFASDRQAATGDGKTYLMVYLPLYGDVTADTRHLSGKRLRVWWFDPSTGSAFPLGEKENTGTFRVDWNDRIRKNMGGPDWVLVIDDAAAGYPAPGKPLIFGGK
jgi:hypothetical protein